jgi:hypothetical protein
MVPPQRRTVMRSKEFDQNPVVAQRSVAIAQIISDIERGNELTKYLSRRVRTGFALPKNPKKKELNKLQHLDLLLNDWRIYHLHLSTTVESDASPAHRAPMCVLALAGVRQVIAMPPEEITPRPVQLGDTPAAGGPVHHAGADEIGPSSTEPAGHADDAQPTNKKRRGTKRRAEGSCSGQGGGALREVCC